MRKSRQTNRTDTIEYVIRKPLYWVIFLGIMFFVMLPLCFLEIPSISSEDTTEFIEAYFYSITGFSIWILVSGFIFILLAITIYRYLRYRLVIHEKGFSITPEFGETFDVPFATVKEVKLVKFSKKGSYVDIKTGHKNIHVPYTVNRHGAFKQAGMDVLLRKFEDYRIMLTEDNNFPH